MFVILSLQAMTKIHFDNIFWEEFDDLTRKPPILNNYFLISDFLEQIDLRSFLTSADVYNLL